ncbi:PREDICTED: uncharacterized protein LOC108760290 isoform X2 [Trachymyrmex cornetzi]|uniref:Uncharacterized protein n=2 Tax=Trachymyrmex cornetzi TaxID=471704 RepID=A0A151JRG3_9HYME|nr:PREDICTED: uncharacterized protein LOC108760290 isoform X2 [Trachymyrmex cornetzi]KYN29932.1 hypothetical protein ALC57_00602 [Trachymyrmex cornetzi]
MRFRFLASLLLCAVSLATTQEVWECQEGVDDELIWEYAVRRPYRIGGYQEVEADYGPTDAKITCIRINSLSDDEDNGTAWVTAGGIGYNFVKLKFWSKYSRGLHYRVLVYGRPTPRSLWLM